MVLWVLTAGAAEPTAVSRYPGDEAGALALVTDLRCGCPAASELILALRPAPADYAAYFDDAATAEAARVGYAALWAQWGTLTVARPEQTAIDLHATPTDAARAWTDAARAVLPGGYERVGPHLRPGLTVYSWRYLAPGATAGMAYDGLVYVDGHWAWFPKPWRALEAPAP